LAYVAVPKGSGIPPAHKAEDWALAGVPVMYLTPGFVWNTHASHTVCPEDTATGLVRATVCHPAAELIAVDAVTPNLDAGDALASSYTPRYILPVPPLW
jgi:hypothetical protein